MPEMPEVEIIRRTLLPLTKGKTIKDITIRWPKMIQNTDADTFRKTLNGQTIHDISRRGKFLIFYFDDYSVVSHLRMEGRYRVEEEMKLDPHIHLVFHFIDGTHLLYRDVRKFGTFHLFLKGEELFHPPLSQLGPEPFSDEFTYNFLKEELKKTTRLIKAVLLDQKVVVGLGNIYVDEVLFRSGIHPERTAQDLNDEEIEKLRVEIIATLKEAIDKGGSTVRSYVNSQGEKGMYQLQLFVYARKGEPCRICGRPIEKIKVAGRSTHLCLNCQH
ncbi:MAG: DNA-formamidopyrimidine glycosylase [Bacillales bacterium]|nr:DNA-formamidopyrimidine glycosylase [Bacillales bacterium]